MNRIKTFIADDERPAREFLKTILNEIGMTDLAGEADNGADAVEMIRELKPDLAILDLKMPEMSGLEVVRTLRRPQMPLVIFATAYDDHAVQAFEVNAVDYLLKPVDKNRLAEALRRVAERLEESDWRSVEADKVKRAAAEIEDAVDSEPIERIPVRVRDEIYLIPTNEVASVVADGELLRITTSDNRKYVINHRLKDLELRLNEREFVRLSRGAIASLEQIERISPMPGGTLLVFLKNGQEIQSSRMQSRMIRSRLLKL
ncbi:MAG: response regulator transcription factor [Acidobacteria bacterium]|nr:response regulator transcription factor [Acidobacteriota bacterium]MCW5948088.1 response regulator transcription factor [Pyrinomonadaceae bacterium]